MTNNKIREFRNDKGLSQQDLAEKVGCTKQYIQRIEGAHEAVRVDIAFEICSILGAGFVDVFPETSEVIEKAMERSSFQADVSQGNNETGKMKEFSQHLFEDADLREGVEKTGIDMFTGEQYFNYNLRGGASGALEITTQEKDRLLVNILNRNSSTPFVAFHSGAWCILLNLDHLLFGQFLFEWGRPQVINTEDAYALEIFFADNSDPEVLSVEEDGTDPTDPESPGQIGSIISMAETMVEPGEFFSIEDEDGELAIFLALDVAMMKAPLWSLYPDLEPPETH